MVSRRGKNCIYLLWSFYHDILPGDVVLARRGRNTLAAVGRVTGPAYYAAAKNPYIHHPNFLEVSWQAEPRNKVFPSVVFPMHTLMELSEKQYQNLLEGTEPEDDKLRTPEGVEDPKAFVLEKYLEDFIVNNSHAIFKGRLQIYVDPEGNDGQQYATKIGPIDILAIEPEDQAFVVIELKKGRPSDQVVGQILRYMGWVKRNLCKDGQPVKGLIICHVPDQKLLYALEMAKNIDVQYYTVSFKLSHTP